VAAAGGAVTALFLVVLTVSIVNAALPAMRTEKLRDHQRRNQRDRRRTP
jgi:hypothetical protein